MDGLRAPFPVSPILSNAIFETHILVSHPAGLLFWGSCRCPTPCALLAISYAGPSNEDQHDKCSDTQQPSE